MHTQLLVIYRTKILKTRME